MAGYTNASVQLKQFWSSRNGRQRALLIGGALATGVLVASFVRLIGVPDYKTLSSGLEPADAQALAAALDRQGISHTISADGRTLSVPADKLDAARMQMASDQDLHSGQMGFEIFDKSSWGETEFDERVNYQRAMEGELARSIETLGNVESARIHLVMASDSIFVDQQQGAKASVILKLRHGTLSKDESLAISRLIAGAVNRLKPEDVAIVDADSGQSLNGGMDAMEGSGGSTELSTRLISTLEPVVGAGKIRASVNIDYDRNTTDENQEKYDPAVSAVLSHEKTEDQSGGNAIPAGVPGTASNVPSAAQSKPAAVPETQHSITENAQYGVNRTVIHTVTPAGRIQRITAAILVDDEVVRSVDNGKVHYSRRKRSQKELAQIRSLAEAVVGFDAKRGDILTLENVSFDTDSDDIEDAAPSRLDQFQTAVSDSSPALRPLALLALFVLVYLLVVRPVQRHILTSGPAVTATPPRLPQESMESLPGASSEAGSARAAQLKGQALEILRQNPLQTTRTVQAWLREENS